MKTKPIPKTHCNACHHKLEDHVKNPTKFSKYKNRKRKSHCKICAELCGGKLIAL